MLTKAVREIKKSNQLITQNQQANRAKEHDFVVGDRVYKQIDFFSQGKVHKFLYRFDGPWIITAQYLYCETASSSCKCKQAEASQRLQDGPRTEVCKGTS